MTPNPDHTMFDEGIDGIVGFLGVRNVLDWLEVELWETLHTHIERPALNPRHNRAYYAVPPGSLVQQHSTVMVNDNGERNTKISNEEVVMNDGRQ